MEIGAKKYDSLIASNIFHALCSRYKAKENMNINMDEKKVGARIKEYRENAGISQELLAEKLGISSTSVSNIERGRNFPSFENFIKICNIIGVAPDLILADVVDAATVAKESELSHLLSRLNPEDRKKVTAVFECIIKTFTEK